MNPMIDLLNSHRSIRKFTAEPIDQATVDALVQAGQAAATSSFIQACTVIQVSQGERRDALAEMAGNQPYVAAAPVFLVFCADMKRHQLACGMHDAEMLSGYTEQFLTASLDCALFAQNVMVAAESLGLGGVYIGGLRNQIAAVADLLELPELVYPVFGLCLGQPDQNPEVKPRLPLDVVLKHDRYDDSADAERIAAYDASVREYYRTRTGGNKEMSWSEQISGMLVKEARPHMLPFLNTKGFIKR
ncbi:MAG: oxygen-insensitive NADPH nitroreductase [Oceanospirillales bacterium]|uniref:Nitroreductase n=1 Tax=Marinobacterium halophilum TaxID=267374 RepID=A0A2P8EZ03_9GAMM|nr:oxygen-insensitive NADPH nitroreductase [Marinobacterium halophilum]MBR9828885.1 oxygen-insensitive NADPH nitroreductase [Oceanospirillales bacterium]PSL14670.1 nitroreductase [Marinobacterium halophilum]